MNYAELSQAISEWSSKDSIDKVMPTIIRFGQRDLEDNLRIRAMEYHPTTASVTAGSSYLALPADFLEMIYAQIIFQNVKYPLDVRVAPRDHNEAFQSTTDTGMPEVCTLLGDNLYFDVLTDQAYTRDWAYYRRLPVLTKDTTVPVGGSAPNSNWWSENAEEAFLMSCLNKLSMYVPGIQESDKKKWAEAALATKGALKTREALEKTGGTTLRSANWK